MADLLSPADDEPVLTSPWAAFATPEEGAAVPDNTLYLENGRLKASGSPPPGSRLVAIQT